MKFLLKIFIDNPWFCSCYNDLQNAYPNILTYKQNFCINDTNKSHFINNNIQTKSEFCDCSAISNKCTGLKDDMRSEKCMYIK